MTGRQADPALVVLLPCLRRGRMPNAADASWLSGSGGNVRYTPVCVALLLSMYASVVAADESVTYCVENYGSINECAGADVPDACDLAAQWNSGLGDHSTTWAQIEQYSNQGVDSSDFVDPAADVDPTGIDFADVALFVGNGRRAFCADAFFTPGDDGGSCSVNIENMVMDLDLDMMTLWASNSVDRCVITAGGSLPPEDDGECETGGPGTGNNYSQIPRNNELKLINGFHGDTFIQFEDHVTFLFAASLMKRYVDVSEFSGWGENFITFFQEGPGGTNSDRCPTSIVYGGDASEFQAIAEAGGFRDRDNGGSFSNCKIFAFPDGCDPVDGDEL